MNIYNQFPKGSEWAKWDLHFHTPSSYDYQDKSVTNQGIIDELVKNNVKVIAITDHHRMDTQRIKELQQLGQNQITVLPAIEFRSELGGSESIHFIAIFSEKADIDDIWTKLAGRLALTDADVQKKTNEKIYSDFKDTSKIVRELGGIVTVHAGSKTNNIENITNALEYKMAVKTDLLEFIAIYEIGKVDDQRMYKDKVFPHIGRILPMILCSDNHNIRKYSVKQNLWIKANPTFEGLRQIIFEPERVRIQEEHPDKKEPYNVIKSVRFIDKKGKFMNEPIYLNSCLNAIIGGKSTGKSLLLHFIAKTLLPKEDNRLFEEKKGGNNKIEKKEKYSFENLDFEVEFADGKKFNLNQTQLPNNTLIEFIPQQWLSDMVENHHKNEAESPYQRLIEKSLSEKEGYDKDKRQYEAECQSLEHIIKNTLNKLFEIQEVIKTSEKERAEMGNRQDFENSIQKLEQEIITLKANSALSEEDKQKFENLQKERTTILQKIKTCENNLKALKSYQEKLQVDWQKFVSEVSENYKMVVQKFTLLDNNFLEPIKKSLNNLSKNFQENIQQITTKENDFSIEKTNLDSQKSRIETDLKPFEDKFANFKKIEDCEKSILGFNQKIEKIQTQESSISVKKDAFEKCKQNVKDTLKNLFEEYQNHINHLNKEYSVIFKADKDNKDLIELHSELGFDYDGFESNFLGNFSIKNSTTKNKQIFNVDVFFENSKINKGKYVEYATQTFDLLLSENAKDLVFVNNKTIKMAIESLFKNRFQIDYKVKYENDWLENMSQGKKGIVLLKLYLAIEKAHYPILIDQPEDNLDNRTIYNSLTDFIKKRKIARQIIMVTHNANLVIATDAEQVIVAHQTILDEVEETGERKSKFEYVTGALEHTKKKDDKNIKETLFQQGIREHVCEILEGGEVAFKKREEKYGLK